uniref:Uncharacterized protein n=1 Tax=Globisporangium ultimum (strain ATCC 200006 / CBS 805.95 / DAOM BR144) TaxID=431595 RepID=K3XAW0_GLOUD
MTSIAASPAYSELKKRSRHAASEGFELSRSKRYRGGVESASVGDESTADAAKDVPKYTQRHVEYFEQAKQAEIARIRAEYEQFILKKEVEFQQCRHELAQVHASTQSRDKEIERLQSENKLLKRAITIQNQQKEECQQENAVLRNLATQAAEHIKRLEQSNYALSVHLQTSTSTSSEHFQPPDVF